MSDAMREKLVEELADVIDLRIAGQSIGRDAIKHVMRSTLSALAKSETAREMALAATRDDPLRYPGHIVDLALRALGGDHA